MFLDDLLAAVLTPVQFAVFLPPAAPRICEHLRDCSARVVGLGDVSSMGAFDVERHGNVKYGSPVPAPKRLRSRQGKLEKSVVQFIT